MVPEPTLLEAQTREAIDKKLEAAGWVIQDKKRLSLDEGHTYCKKITYKIGKHEAEESIKAIRNISATEMTIFDRMALSG